MFQVTSIDANADFSHRPSREFRVSCYLCSSYSRPSCSLGAVKGMSDDVVECTQRVNYYTYQIISAVAI